jgi:hypothetical protein
VIHGIHRVLRDRMWKRVGTLDAPWGSGEQVNPPGPHLSRAPARTVDVRDDDANRRGPGVITPAQPDRGKGGVDT